MGCSAAVLVMIQSEVSPEKGPGRASTAAGRRAAAPGRGPTLWLQCREGRRGGRPTASGHRLHNVSRTKQAHWLHTRASTQTQHMERRMHSKQHPCLPRNPALPHMPGRLHHLPWACCLLLAAAACCCWLLLSCSCCCCCCPAAPDHIPAPAPTAATAGHRLTGSSAGRPRRCQGVPLQACCASGWPGRRLSRGTLLSLLLQGPGRHASGAGQAHQGYTQVQGNAGCGSSCRAGTDWCWPALAQRGGGVGADRT